MGYDRIETFVKNEKKPYEYCLDFEYGNSAYETLNPIERYLAYKSTGVCSLLSGYKIKYSRHTKVNLERDWLFLF